MSDPQDARLREAIREAAGKARKYRDRFIGEQNTKASLIEPVLESLGWDIRDPDIVHREYRSNSRDNPVDYALSILRKPRLFVEAKGLGETLSDRKWIGQTISYAAVAGVEWCVLTDGDEYRFYNAVVPLDADEKLFCRAKLTEEDEETVANMLLLISHDNMEGNLIEVLWNAHFVDRRVKDSLRSMIQSGDKSLIRLVCKREPKLTPKNVADSLRRLDIRIESETPIPGPAPTDNKRPIGPTVSLSRKRRISGDKARGKAKSKAHIGVSLSDLIRTGYLAAPLRLFRRYKGATLEATMLPDGSVEYQGERYRSGSTAADIARASVTGRRMNTNGWVFWQFDGPNGKPVELGEARSRYLEDNQKG
jgi:predicted type IV restriction endonuclease